MTKEQAFNVLNNYAFLEDGWDGCGSLKPYSEILGTSVELIESLPLEEIEDVCPNPQGTISIEYLNGPRKLSIEIGLSAYSYFITTPKSLYNSTDLDFEPLYQEALKFRESPTAQL